MTTQKNNHSHQEAETEAFIQNLRHVTLSKSEAHDMRERLIAYADLHDVVPASTLVRVSSFSYLVTHLSRSMIALSLVCVLLIGGTGVTYAAQNSLPGQPLYALKVDIAEPIQTALITAPAAKAHWENTLASRRLAEASSLAAKNDLASSTQEYLAQAVATHVALSQQAADTLAASGNDAEALAARSDLEARLSEHSDVLALMTAHLDSGEEASSTGAVFALLRNLRSERTAIEMSHEAASSETATSTDEHAVAIAYTGNESDGMHAKATLSRNRTSLFGLFPAAASTTDASTTASSTGHTATSTDSGESSHKTPWYRLIPPFMASSTISAPPEDSSDSH